MATYAILVGGTVSNVIDAPSGHGPTGSVEIDGLTPEPGIGWTLTAGVWAPPAVPVTQANAATVAANVAANQALIEAWIAANPAGAVLTAAQTLTLAKMLNGLCRILLSQYGATTGT